MNSWMSEGPASTMMSFPGFRFRHATFRVRFPFMILVRRPFTLPEAQRLVALQKTVMNRQSCSLVESSVGLGKRSSRQMLQRKKLLLPGDTRIQILSKEQ